MTALESKVLELLNHRVTLKMAQTVIECVKKECTEALESRMQEEERPGLVTYWISKDKAIEAIETVK